MILRGNKSLLSTDNFILGILGAAATVGPSDYVTGVTQLSATLGFVVCAVDSFLGRDVGLAAEGRDSRLVAFFEEEPRTDNALYRSCRRLWSNPPSDSLMRCIDRQSPSEAEAVLDQSAVNACDAVVVIGRSERDQDIARQCRIAGVPCHRRTNAVEFFNFISKAHKDWRQSKGASEVIAINALEAPIQLG